jgi:hypothetical protein
MKSKIQKNPVLLFVLILLIAGSGYAQDDCEVKLEAISGTYEGGCKKGLAEGQGTAKGEDTYVGDFKKGLPHGTGTYTWANGDVYEGEFKKGRKEGEGKMWVALPDGQKKEQVGFWADDEYIGESKNPYEIVNQSPNIMSIRITKTDNSANDGNALFVEILHKGRQQSTPEFGLSVNAGSFTNRFPTGNLTKILVSQFPFNFTMNYMGESATFQFNQQTSWKITMDFNK